SPGGLAGDNVGTTTIDGDFTLAAGGFYYVEADPSAPWSSPANPGVGDRTIVTGTAKLAGTLRAITATMGGTVADYVVSGNEWLIIDASAGLEGSFDEEVSDLAFLAPLARYDYDNSDVWLSFVQSGSFSDYAYTRNQRAVAAALETLDAGSGLYVDLVSGTVLDQARQTLDGLSGESHATLKAGLMKLGTSFMDSLARRVSLRPRAGNVPGEMALGDSAPAAGEGAVVPAGGPNGLWVSIEASHARFRGDGNAGRASFYGPEVSVGYQRDFAGGWFGGLAFRYGDKKMEVDSRDSKLDMDAVAVALYGGKETPLGPGALRLLLGVGAGWYSVDSERRVTIGATTQTLRASYHGESFFGFMEAAYPFSPTGGVILEPFATLGWQGIRLGGFRERGGNAALVSHGERWDDAHAAVGVRTSFRLGQRVSLSLEPGWRHSFGGVAPVKELGFAQGGDRFRARGPALSRDEAFIGAGLSLGLTDRLRLGLDYNGSLGNRGQSHGGTATMAFNW
ncbi:MAG: autotransporter outer membrane beta-barrel domain-containing protein, partial [Deltaproteobacteria bacterium]|nr:autotransporter outer membrane beta-barrel domain-containing protein [Deltaproteobacteria bacterium]